MYLCAMTVVEPLARIYKRVAHIYYVGLYTFERLSMTRCVLWWPRLGQRSSRRRWPINRYTYFKVLYRKSKIPVTRFNDSLAASYVKRVCIHARARKKHRYKYFFVCTRLEYGSGGQSQTWTLLSVNVRTSNERRTRFKYAELSEYDTEVVIWRTKS